MPINYDALVNAQPGAAQMTSAEKRELRAQYEPFSSKEIKKSLQQMIIGALHDLGGQQWLVKQAERNPVAFMALAGKLIPIEARTGDAEMKIIVVMSGNNDGNSQVPGVINSPLKLVSSNIVDAEEITIPRQGEA